MALNIVIADDFPDAREPLAWYLGLDGHLISQAGDGESAFALILDRMPDVCFLDIGMPKLDGFALARRIRAAPWGKTMYLVALSGFVNDESVALAAGYDEFVAKPADPDDIRRICNERIAAKQGRHPGAAS